MAYTLIQNDKTASIQKYFWLFVSRILPLIALFFIMIVYSRKLSYKDYGEFQSVWMYANIVNVIISFGISAVIFSTNLNFLFSFMKNNKKVLIGFYTILWIFVLSLFFAFAKNFNTSLKFVLILFIVIQNITTVSETLFIKRGKEKASGIINLFYALLFLGWHIYILLTGYSLFALVGGITILSFIKLCIVTVIPARNNEVNGEKTDENTFLFHWGYLGMSDVLAVISKWLDKAFLLYFLTASDFAVFFNGSFEIPLFGLLISVTGNFLLIEISQNTKLVSKIIKLYRESFNILSVIVFPLFFFLFFFRTELFSLAFNNRYNASLPIFVISIFIIPIHINNYSVILQCFAQGKKVLLGSILDIVVAMSLMLILYPTMGTRGIALSIVISTFCQAVYYLWHSAKILNSSFLQLVPFQKLILKFIIIGLVYFALFFVLSGVNIKIKLLVTGFITAIICLGGLYKYLRSFF
ncbi:MAG: polysaccharide biosynthesis C-terminal domain-containing protein [Ginsengibacter sp.]